MLVYLGICAVLAFLGAVIAAFLAVPPVPTFHIAFAAGALPLIFGAIIHFVPVLTRTAMPGRSIHVLPLAGQLAGITTPLGLAGLLPVWSLHAAASMVVLIALILTLWVARRLRSTLGAPHPGARWYGAALLCLFFAVSLVPVWLTMPELRAVLRLFHLHLNTLGFIGLAALGTLPVLLPTALGKPDPSVGLRLRTDLPVAAAGAVLVAAGAAVTAGTAAAIWLAVGGALLMTWALLRNFSAWRRVFTIRSIVGDGATAPLAVASAGFVLLLWLGIAHGVGAIAARPALAAYVALFLLPLVTGALTQLLPVWRHPGRDTSQRRQLRQRLAFGGRWRALLFLVGGSLLAFDVDAGWPGWLFTVLGLLLFVGGLMRAFWLDRPMPSDDNPLPN